MCRRIPVSPDTPLSVIETALPVGGTMVHATTVLPPVGSVMVFAPEARVLISMLPGEAALEAAEMVSVPVVSPVKVMVVVRVAVTLMRRNPL